jgi:hypothetical protein
MNPETALAQLHKYKEEFENNSRFTAKLLEYDNTSISGGAAEDDG